MIVTWKLRFTFNASWLSCWIKSKQVPKPVVKCTKFSSAQKSHCQNETDSSVEIYLV